MPASDVCVYVCLCLTECARRVIKFAWQKFICLGRAACFRRKVVDGKADGEGRGTGRDEEEGNEVGCPYTFIFLMLLVSFTFLLFL